MQTRFAAAITAILTALTWSGTATAEDPDAEKRAHGLIIYAMAEAGSEYCPDIKIRFGTRMTISEVFGYSPPVDDTAIAELEREKQALFTAFRSVPRATACERLMQEYGPGGRPHLFDFN